MFLDACRGSHLPPRLICSTPVGSFALCPVSIFCQTPPDEWNASLLLLLRDHEAGVELKDVLWSLVTSVSLQDQLFAHGAQLFEFLLPFFETDQTDEDWTNLFMQTHNDVFAQLLMDNFSERIKPELMSNQVRTGIALTHCLPFSLLTYTPFIRCSTLAHPKMWRLSALVWLTHHSPLLKKNSLCEIRRQRNFW